MLILTGELVPDLEPPAVVLVDDCATDLDSDLLDGGVADGVCPADVLHGAVSAAREEVLLGELRKVQLDPGLPD